MLQLEEVAKLHWAEHTAQKARRKAKAKAREEAKRQKVAEEEEKRKRMLEYFQQLQDKVLKEEAALLESIKGSQVMKSKYKEVATRDEEGQRPFFIANTSHMLGVSPSSSSVYSTLTPALWL